MGIPKFFRWVSERFPLINVKIEGTVAPSIDMLYLDMNGIIHNCTHPSEDVTARIAEKDMVISIFNYIDKLFHAVKPTKLFFMAIDGPAPRAKMNQQRGRRFRSALAAQQAVAQAIKEGKEMPKEPAFDSNTITPGTDFMDRLTKHLKWFIRKKISEDSSWRGIEVIFSGPEVPGEGEHKIMQYIRTAKSRPNYDANLTHCIYGLDADLIMLGLTSHEPNFCLLREEVLNRESKTSRKDIFLQSQFHFLSLTLLREYLDLEFSAMLRDRCAFAYDLERAIDDFVFMCFLIGNDFLPTLPSLDIAEGGLDLLLQWYGDVLPRAGGYLTEGGRIVVERVQLFLRHVAQHESKVFSEPEIEFDDAFHAFVGHTGDAVSSDDDDDDSDDSSDDATEAGAPGAAAAGSALKAKKKGAAAEPVLDLALRAVFEAFDSDESRRRLVSPPQLSATQRRVWHLLAEEFGMKSQSVGEGPERAVVVDKLDGHIARPPVAAAVAAAAATAEPDDTTWMDAYYRMRFEGSDHGDAALLDAMAFSYLQGLAWVLHYYHHGCVSWGWYYPYHYAPLANDLREITRFSSTFDQFELGQPFLPYQQLLAVLPPASRTALPRAYWRLMTDSDSPIIDYYPTDFRMDLNGKVNDWEAVVLIPFIDAVRLLEAVAAVDTISLNAEEVARNLLGDALLFRFDKDNLDAHPATLPGFFSDIREGHSRCVVFHMPTNVVSSDVFRLLPEARTGAAAVGLTPTFHTLSFTSALRKIHVNVFGRPSNKPTRVITLPSIEGSVHARVDKESESQYLDRLGKLVGKLCVVRWPHWLEGRVSAVSTSFGRAETAASGKGYAWRRFEGRDKSGWEKDAAGVAHLLLTTLGLDCTRVDVLLHVQPLAGMRLLENGATKKYFSQAEAMVPLQAALLAPMRAPDVRYTERPPTPLHELYPVGMQVVCNVPSQYGNRAVVVGHEGEQLVLDVSVGPPVPKFGGALAEMAGGAFASEKRVADKLRMSLSELSRLTGTIMVAHKGKKHNLGLKLKFKRAMQQIMGYSFAVEQMSAHGPNRVQWEYSTAAVELIRNYVTLFPEVLRYLQRSGGADNDMASATDVFAGLDATAAGARVVEAERWLDAQTYRKLPRVPAGSEALDERALRLLDTESAKWRAQVVAGGAPPVKRVTLTARDVRRPVQDVIMIDPNTPTRGRFLLCDRVMNLLDNGPLAFGMQGFVVAFTGTTLTVLFDEEFAAGSNFGDVITGRKIGSGIAAATLLNMTRFNAPTLERNDWLTQVLPEVKSALTPATGGGGGGGGGASPPRGADRSQHDRIGGGGRSGKGDSKGRRGPGVSASPLGRSADSAQARATSSAPPGGVSVPTPGATAATTASVATAAAATATLAQSVPATLPSQVPAPLARSADAAPRAQRQPREPKAKHLSTPTTVFVSNLPFQLSDAEVLAWFADCGGVKATIVKRGQALVDMRDAAGYSRALSKNGTMCGDRAVQVIPDRKQTQRLGGSRTAPPQPSATFAKPINKPAAAAEDPDDFDPDQYFQRLQGSIKAAASAAASAPALPMPAAEPRAGDAKLTRPRDGKSKDKRGGAAPRQLLQKSASQPPATLDDPAIVAAAQVASDPAIVSASGAEDAAILAAKVREQRLKVLTQPQAVVSLPTLIPAPVAAVAAAAAVGGEVAPAAAAAAAAAPVASIGKGKAKPKQRCKFFAAQDGYCRKGAQCPFLHE